MANIKVSTISDPEFINVKPINPLISECEIKVFYLGKNRNRTFISKEVATEMANSLPGCPIVGYFNEKKEDFTDHGEQVIIDDEGIRFNNLTTPYGFVAPNAKIWFQKFKEEDEFGNIEEREYLLTTGYLWTGIYEESKSIIEHGKPQSMEFDEESVDGRWAEDKKTNMEYFIVNDALFKKLCILGDDVEPCFEDAKITKKDISTSFSKIDDNFKFTLYSMMQELKNVLEGDNMAVTEKIEKNQVDPNKVDPNKVNTSFTQVEDKSQKNILDEKEGIIEDYKLENSSLKNNYSNLEEKFNKLEEKYNLLNDDYKKLQSFKLKTERKEKEDLIKSVYVLSDEDKKEVLDNIDKYSLSEIESKLAVICFRKKVNFNLEEEEVEKGQEEKNIEDPVSTYNLNNDEDLSIPAWVKAIKNNKENI